MATKERALYLIAPEGGKPVLVHGDQVKDKKAAGFKEPTGTKANGTTWNDPENDNRRNAAAASAKLSAEVKSKKQAKLAADAETARLAAEKARVAAPPLPADYRVEIVNPVPPNAVSSPAVPPNPAPGSAR